MRSLGATLYALLFFVAIVYWPGLDGGLLLDDQENLRPLADFEKGVIGWHEAVWASDSGPLRRPLAMLTFLANMAFSGPDVWTFKYTNLLIHLLCGVLIAWISGRLIAILRPTHNPTRVWALALAIAAAWMLAPLLVSTTLYVVQRMMQLSTLLSFSGLLAYISGREQLDRRPLVGWSLILSSVMVWMPLAAFSKENGLLLPLLLFVVEIFFFRFAGLPLTRRALIAFFLVFLALPALIALSIVAATPEIVLGGYAVRSFSFVERVMTEPRVLFFYVANLLVPHGAGMGLFHDDFSVSKGLLTPPTTLLAIVGWSAIIGLAVTQAKRRWWPLLFGPVFFLAGHAMESTVLSLELVFEHRNYLSAFGIFFSLIMGLDSLAAKMRRPAPIFAMMLFLPALYGFATYQRAKIWASWDQILLAAEQAHPNSPRVHVELASLYSVTGQLDAALVELDKIQALRPTAASAVALHRLIVYCNSGDEIPTTAYHAIPSSMATDDARIYTIIALRGLNKALYLHQCPKLNVQQLAAKVASWTEGSGANGSLSEWWDVHYELAQMYYYSGKPISAIRHLSEARALAPQRPEAWLVMMRYQLAYGDLPGATRTYAEFRNAFSNTDLNDGRLAAAYEAISRVIETANQEARTR